MRLDEAEAVVDASGVAERLEAALPVGVRPRQLSVRTLVLGIVVALGDGRPAHLTRVHTALVSLAPSDRRRLGVLVEWKCGPHVLTHRQIERTFSLVTRVLRKAEPDGTPAAALQEMVDSLSEASVSDTYKEASSSYAVDWTDLETFGRPVANNETGGASPMPPGAIAGTTVPDNTTKSSSATTCRASPWSRTRPLRRCPSCVGA